MPEEEFDAYGHHWATVSFTPAELAPIREILNRRLELEPDLTLQDVVREAVRRYAMDEMQK